MNATTANNRLLLIINPISGIDTKESIEPLMREHMTKAGYTVDVAYTCARGDATRLANKAVANGYKTVVAAGGDGTVNETAKALCGTGINFGIIPCGSGNGLARHLGVPMDLNGAIKLIATNHTLDIDYGSANGMPFFCTFGVGFDAAVSDNFARQHRRGKLSYIKSAIAEYVKYHPQVYTLSANGQVITEKAFLIAVCNASQYGNNAYIAPHANITDGLLDITIIHAGNPLDTALVGVDLFTGYINSNTMINTFRTPSAIIYRTKNGPAHLDGEPVTIDDTIEIKCHPNQLRVFTSKNEKKFRPIITPIENMLSDMSASLSKIFNN
ncbi:MAG: diacylglycerol kinase family lipid kinase [Muribaculum sp.]|nr:diacylglycerol kinase family lipid kinase [Muribaculaceae bacterium]MCM1080337.1 diacylglycerol kinase family lipid kinase [Muribaculum sp.]